MLRPTLEKIGIQVSPWLIIDAVFLWGSGLLWRLAEVFSKKIFIILKLRDVEIRWFLNYAKLLKQITFKAKLKFHNLCITILSLLIIISETIIYN